MARGEPLIVVLRVVRVRFGAEVAPIIRERQWHGTQAMTKLDDGALELSMQTAGPRGVLNWVNSYMPHGRVLSPKWLADEQRQAALKWMEGIAEEAS